MSPSIEAGLWVLASLVARPAARILWPRWQSRAGEWRDLVEGAAPWLLAMGPMYLSLMTGAMLGSRLGLYGFGLEGNLMGALAGALIAASLYGMRRYRSERIKLPAAPGYDAALQDELRWAFYRGAAASWLGEFWLGGLVGWGAAVVEWLLAVQPWHSVAWREPDQWQFLVRAAVSAGLYMISHNFWLVLAFQILAAWVWQVALEPGDPDQGDSS